MAATCRYYGISRTVFYQWKYRYDDEGLDGLKDHSSAPMHCPTATQPEVVGQIIHLRQHYHFGSMKIAMYLQRYHDITISTSGVWRILKRLDMNRLPASQRHKRHQQRWKRYEKQRPGHHSRSTSSSSSRSYLPRPAQALLPVHRHRRLHRQRLLRIYPRSDQKTAIQFLDYVVSRLPFRVEKIQTDNGALHVIRHWIAADRAHHPLPGGGVAQNTSLNGKILQLSRLDSGVFVLASSHDAGAALGAASISRPRRQGRQ